VEEKKKEKKWEQSDIFNVMTKSKISFHSIRQYSRFIWEVTFSERTEAHIERLTAYIPMYMVIKNGVIKDVPEDMELENLMQQQN
jgi:hypothetical protein